VGELVIGVARVNQLSGEGPEAGELNSAVEALDHISRDLQEQVMRVRMIPIEATFNRFQRVVRDLASELGKKIHLELAGAETELDKNVIEQIADPLKHLIRNSADHGLEPPADRAAAGKPETGTIWLKAYQQEGKIIIEVADDGRGIDRDRVLAKAVERGLAPAGSSFSDQEAFAFMFQPGFSTAQAVTEVSGRGVGLDVVRQNIEALRGSVEVESAPGRGSTFRIKLPLTLAIIDGMTVKVGEEVLTLPLLSILESLRPQQGDIQKVEGRGELITVRGEYLPLVRLYEVFRFPTERTDPTEALVVIIESVSKRFGVLVDDILGEQQAVIKSLEQNYQKVEGVAGATILGDGRVSLILDIHGLEKLAFG
jgi:two-component system chemotaxis sensor kinase CheA